MFQTILVPLDGSSLSELALPVARDLALLTGGRILLFTVVLGYEDAHVPEVPRLDAQAKKRAETYLEAHIATVKHAGVDVEGHVGHGAPATEVLAYARASGADLIVMGTSGIGAKGLHALGSVAMKVLEVAPCPVMMVRPTS